MLLNRQQKPDPLLSVRATVRLKFSLRGKKKTTQFCSSLKMLACDMMASSGAVAIDTDSSIISL